MLLLWRIRYLDSRDRRFKDRDLCLATDPLDPVTKAAVELCRELHRSDAPREILKYRRLFREEKSSETDLNALSERHAAIDGFCVPDYFEDGNGQELTWKRMAEILTGDPNAIMLPAGFRQHDIDYYVSSDRRPIPIGQISLSGDDLRILGYFTRELREMQAAAFYKDGPGRLYAAGHGSPKLQTAATDDEIRSFVTIFRRLYMKKEPASFLKAVDVFARVTQDHPLGRWVAGAGAEYDRDLLEPPDLFPCTGQTKLPFSRKRLIDVFLYTQYAHQPDPPRARQYRECLRAVGGQQALLRLMFLTEIWRRGLEMANAGRFIADLCGRYCQAHGVSCDVVPSAGAENPAIGALEKKGHREERLFEEFAANLAAQRWEERGRPGGGPAQFQNEARAQLAAAMAGK